MSFSRRYPCQHLHVSKIGTRILPIERLRVGLGRRCIMGVFLETPSLLLLAIKKMRRKPTSVSSKQAHKEHQRYNDRALSTISKQSIMKALTRFIFCRFTFIRSDMTPARAIQQSPSSFLEDSSTSSMDSSPLEAELERERRRYWEERELCYLGFM